MPQSSETDSTHIVEGTRRNFDEIVLSNSRVGPVLVNYWSRGAGPCLRLFPVLDTLVRDFGGRVLRVNIDTDSEGGVAREYGVTSVPTLKLFRDRKVLETIHGYQSDRNLRTILGRHIAPPDGEPVQEALGIYHMGDRKLGMQRLAEAAVNDPSGARAPLAMAKLLWNEQRPDEAHRLLSATPPSVKEDTEVRDLLAHLEFFISARDAPDAAGLTDRSRETPDDLEARFQLASLRLIEDDVEGALTLLQEIVEQNRTFRNGAALRGMHALFRMLGENSELTRRFRGKLGRSLA